MLRGTWMAVVVVWVVLLGVRAVLLLRSVPAAFKVTSWSVQLAWFCLVSAPW